MAATSITQMYNFTVFPRRNKDAQTQEISNWSLVFKRDTFPVKSLQLCTNKVLNLENKPNMYISNSEHLQELMKEQYEDFFYCFLTITDTEIKLVGKTENVLRNGMDMFLKEVLPEDGDKLAVQMIRKWDIRVRKIEKEESTDSMGGCGDLFGEESYSY